MELLKYNDFIKLINEGLIRSYPSIFIQKKIMDKFGIGGRIERGYVIEQPISNLNDEQINELLHDMVYLYGYYPTSIYIDGLRYRFEEKLLKNTKNILSYIKSFFNKKSNRIIRFEAKYQSPKPIPRIVYHLTLEKHIPSIMLKGLIPKSNSKVSKYPGRIYFFPNIEECFKYSKMRNYNEKYAILKINLGKYVDDAKHSKLMIYQDPDSITGIFTIINIPPEYIKIEELFEIENGNLVSKLESL